ncbi:DUF2617 family protein [Conexibacter sp. W3-3-2]|uniref:DUF2617 domain-containing protein n=1 Tax=Paraconexibacter algicola TaxID=2133960 RepID=A0A2T4UBL7_9ACTN|nr:MULTISPECIES: DUF2617 family protein [Solirubrobacterales]MTD44342.1 DUF2617 family protein [Conexibacter sp. W3-3-2]PTL54294.1 DUF2617 domain-containing protein [Paraconexibacter algicola]
MKLALATPYADVRAADLVLRLDRAPGPTLGTRRVRVGGLEVELGLLGHSHQVHVRGDGVALCEVLACDPGRPGDLPAVREHDRITHTYRFTAEVLPLGAADGLDLADAVAVDPDGLVGLFPGHVEAFTALRARAVGREAVSWETWHAYPQTDELVHTTTTVTVRR